MYGKPERIAVVEETQESSHEAHMAASLIMRPSYHSPIPFDLKQAQPKPRPLIHSLPLHCTSSLQPLFVLPIPLHTSPSRPSSTIDQTEHIEVRLPRRLIVHLHMHRHRDRGVEVEIEVHGHRHR